MTAAVDNDDGFEVPSKKKVLKKNLYIGNLPASQNEQELANLLRNLLREECSLSDADVLDLQIHLSDTSCHALLPCVNQLMDVIIQKLHRKFFQGKKLVVQRERKKKPCETNGNNGLIKNKQKAFGTWSQSAVEHVGQVVKEEIEQADDPVNTAIAAAAAVGVMSSLSTDNPLLSQPIDDLLADYGEQDLNWKQMISVTNNEIQESAKEEQSESRLTQLGKAPIHHPMKYEMDGVTHSHSLYTIAATWGTVPGHLIWQDGLSGVVKRELLWNTDIRNVANGLAGRVADVVIDAINEGGSRVCFSFENVSISSERAWKASQCGLCELAATALRKRLRANENNQFREPCSVDTYHRDLPNRASRSAPSKSNKKDIFEE